MSSPVSLLLLVVAASTAAASDPGTGPQSGNLADLSIEELMNESITSVSKKEQRIGQAPAAIYVLTAEEILRAGHTTIPEALRMVPGLSVARLDSHNWIVTSRGFADQYAGKLLVLIDGRTVYDPFFSGVNWSLQDVMLEDLERIEVIRGPGATLWGANAVNGVINVITKRASDSPGGLATVGLGTDAHYGALRYGGQAWGARYRAYVKLNDYTDFVDVAGNSAQDDWRMWRAGFRADWQASPKSDFTLQSDLYGGELHTINSMPSLSPPYGLDRRYEDDVSGVNILGRWTHTRDARSRWTVQTYYDRIENQDAFLGIARDTFDIELQEQRDLGSRHSLVYGAGYRFTHADYSDSFLLSYANDHDTSGLANAFIQDEIQLIPHELALSLGSKIERNEFSGWEVQPSARMLWTPDETYSVWAAVSRAVRTTNLGENGLRINYAVFDVDGPGPTPPRVLSILPNADLESESTIAHEAGIRLRPSPRLYLDVTGFVNVYDDLVTTEPAGTVLETTPTPAHLVIATRNVNSMHGKTHGIELASSWRVTDWWTVAGAYSWLQMELRSNAAGQAGEEQEGNSPNHQVHLRSLMQGPRGIALGTALYYVEGLPNQGISSYVRLDANLAWRPTANLTMSIAGTNLLDRRHGEFVSYADAPAQVERAVYGRLAWRF